MPSRWAVAEGSGRFGVLVVPPPGSQCWRLDWSEFCGAACRTGVTPESSPKLLREADVAEKFILHHEAGAKGARRQGHPR